MQHDKLDVGLVVGLVLGGFFLLAVVVNLIYKSR